MTLSVLDPITITGANLVSHNQNEPSPEYASGTTYAAGAVVKVASRKRLYESLHGANQGNAPPLTGSDTHWLDRGAMLPWRLFDGGPGSEVVSAGRIEIRIAPGKLAQGVALIGVNASEMSLTVYDAGGAVVMPEKVIPLANTDAIVDYLTLLTVPPTFSDLAIRDDLVMLPGFQVRIRVGAVGETVKVGEMVVGNISQHGTATSGLRSEFVDYSAENVDAYGNAEIVQRGYTFNRDYPVKVRNERSGEFERRLATLRARRALYYVDANLATRYGIATYGRLTNLIKTTDAGGWSDFNVTVEGRL